MSSAVQPSRSSVGVLGQPVGRRDRGRRPAGRPARPRGPRRRPPARSGCGSRTSRRSRRCGGCCAGRGTGGSGSRARRGSRRPGNRRPARAGPASANSPDDLRRSRSALSSVRDRVALGRTGAGWARPAASRARPGRRARRPARGARWRPCARRGRAGCRARRPAPQERGDPAEASTWRVVPDAEVGRADPALGADRGGLGEDQAGAAGGARREVGEVPVVRDARVRPVGRRGVLAHRRHPDPVGDGQRPQGEGLEQGAHGVLHVVEDLGAGTASYDTLVVRRDVKLRWSRTMGETARHQERTCRPRARTATATGRVLAHPARDGDPSRGRAARAVRPDAPADRARPRRGGAGRACPARTVELPSPSRPPPTTSGCCARRRDQPGLPGHRQDERAAPGGPGRALPRAARQRARGATRQADRLAPERRPARRRCRGRASCRTQGSGAPRTSASTAVRRCGQPPAVHPVRDLHRPAPQGPAERGLRRFDRCQPGHSTGRRPRPARSSSGGRRAPAAPPARRRRQQRGHRLLGAGPVGADHPGRAALDPARRRTRRARAAVAAAPAPPHAAPCRSPRRTAARPAECPR